MIAGVFLFGVRVSQFASFPPAYLLAIESFSWILTVFAFGSLYLKGPSNALSYLSQAAYPIYILHMIFLYLGSMWVFPMLIPVQLQFVLVVLVTFAGSFGTFELIRRVSAIRPLFGLKSR